MREPSLPARMRAAVITAPGQLEVHEVDTPAPTAHRVDELPAIPAELAAPARELAS